MGLTNMPAGDYLLEASSGCTPQGGYDIG